MKATIDLPETLFREAKALAALEGVRLKDLVAESLRRHLASAKTSPTAAAPSPTLHDRLRKYCGTVQSGAGDLASNPKHLEGFGED